MGNQQRILADYNPATGWLENRVDGLGQQTAQAIAYHWDSIGRLQSRSDLVSISQSEVFSYDDDNRLTKVQYSSTGDIDDLVTRQRIEYDAAGNIKCKSDTYGASASACTWGDDSGDYLYDQYNQPHAVIEAGNREFEYDANGNVIRDFTGGASEHDLREYEYSVADRLQRIVRDGTETRFFYGASREKRIKRIDSPDGVYWTFYVGSTEITHSESELDVSGYQHVTSGRVQRHVAGVLIVDKEFRSSIYAFSYLHKNHQGSIVAQFTAYTHKGYTGHEHVDQAGIIHMEGRIYDPILGRFLQADPLIEDVGTLNRYTYVHNNPLAFVDPNGFFSIGNVLKGLAIAAISIATGFAASGLWAAGMKAGAIAVAAAGGAITGFVATGTGEGALVGAFTAVAAFGVTQYLRGQDWAFDSGSFTTEGTIARSVGVGLSSGISSDLQGGNFGHGFVTAGVSSLVSPAISDMSDSDYLNAFGASLVGGTLSKATGGKFANGAATAAFSYAVGVAAQNNSGPDMPEFDLETSEGRDGFASWLWKSRERFGIDVPEGTRFQYVDEYVMDTPIGVVPCEGRCTDANLTTRVPISGEYSEKAGLITLYRGSFDPVSSAMFKRPNGSGNIEWVPTSNMTPRSAAAWTLGHEAAHSRGVPEETSYPHFRAEYYGYEAYRSFRASGGN